MVNINEERQENTDNESNYSDSEYDSDEENQEAFWGNVVLLDEGFAEINLPSNFVAANELLLIPQALLELFYPFFRATEVPIVLLAFTVEQVPELSICYLNKKLTQHQSWYQIESCDPLAVILQVTQFDE